eukprot:COSAG01_NODE_34901_length_540_cov_1.079365_1_plen_54_part_10
MEREGPSQERNNEVVFTVLPDKKAAVRTYHPATGETEKELPTPTPYPIPELPEP